MRGKLMLFLSLSLLSLSVAVWASEPRFSYSQDLDDMLRVGDSMIGEIVINRQSYERDTIETSDFSSLSAQQHDRLNWSGASSIEMTAPDGNTDIITSGGSFVFSHAGVHQYQSLSNSSKTGEVKVSEAEVADVEIIADSSAFPVSVQGEGLLDKEERIFDVRADVDETVQPGSYDVDFSIFSDFQTYNFTKTFIVDRQETWAISDDNLKRSIVTKSGDVAEMGELIIRNTGNVNFNITSQVSGNGSDFVIVPGKKRMIRGIDTRFNFAIQIPDSQPDATFSPEVVVSGGNRTESFKLQINITDTDPPTIEEFNTSSPYTGIPNTIMVRASDNIGTTNATISYENSTFTMNRDQQFFTRDDIFFNTTKIYDFRVCVEDRNQNRNCSTYNRSFDPAPIVNISDKYAEMPTQRTTSWAKFNIFNLTHKPHEPIPIRLSEISFSSNENVSFEDYSIRINQDGSSPQTFDSLNSSIEIEEAGEVHLQVRSEIASEYDITLRMELPYYYEQDDEMGVFGAFKTYEIGEAFSFDAYQRKVHCKPVDNGNFETSYTECTIQQPIDTQKEDMAVLVTAREQRLFNRNISETVDSLKGKISAYQTGMSVFVGIAIVLVLGILYVVRVYPFQRTRSKGRKLIGEVKNGNVQT